MDGFTSLGFLSIPGGFIHQKLRFNQELWDFLLLPEGTGIDRLVVLSGNDYFLGVDASQDIQLWLDPIASRTTFLDSEEGSETHFLEARPGAWVKLFYGLGRPLATQKASLFVSLASIVSQG